VPWLAGPTGPLGPGTLATPKRDYAAIADKNIFLGQVAVAEVPQPIELTRYVHLTDITTNSRKVEAFLYNRATGRDYKLPLRNRLRLIRHQG